MVPRFLLLSSFASCCRYARSLLSLPSCFSSLLSFLFLLSFLSFLSFLFFPYFLCFPPSCYSSFLCFLAFLFFLSCLCFLSFLFFLSFLSFLFFMSLLPLLPFPSSRSLSVAFPTSLPLSLFRLFLFVPSLHHNQVSRALSTTFPINHVALWSLLSFYEKQRSRNSQVVI